MERTHRRVHAGKHRPWLSPREDVAVRLPKYRGCCKAESLENGVIKDTQQQQTAERNKLKYTSEIAPLFLRCSCLCSEPVL